MENNLEELTTLVGTSNEIKGYEILTELGMVFHTKVVDKVGLSPKELEKQLNDTQLDVLDRALLKAHELKGNAILRGKFNFVATQDSILVSFTGDAASVARNLTPAPR
jgi:uncharacterized protein YbjQ (UPF0145 family)